MALVSSSGSCCLLLPTLSISLCHDKMIISSRKGQRINCFTLSLRGQKDSCFNGPLQPWVNVSQFSTLYLVSSQEGINDCGTFNACLIEPFRIQYCQGGVVICMRKVVLWDITLESRTHVGKVGFVSAWHNLSFLALKVTFLLSVKWPCEMLKYSKYLTKAIVGKKFHSTVALLPPPP